MGGQLGSELVEAAGPRKLGHFGHTPADIPLAFVGEEERVGY